MTSPEIAHEIVGSVAALVFVGALLVDAVILLAMWFRR